MTGDQQPTERATTKFLRRVVDVAEAGLAGREPPSPSQGPGLHRVRELTLSAEDVAAMEAPQPGAKLIGVRRQRRRVPPKER